MPLPSSPIPSPCPVHKETTTFAEKDLLQGNKLKYVSQSLFVCVILSFPVCHFFKKGLIYLRGRRLTITRFLRQIHVTDDWGKKRFYWVGVLAVMRERFQEWTDRQGDRKQTPSAQKSLPKVITAEIFARRVKFILTTKIKNHTCLANLNYLLDLRKQTIINALVTFTAGALLNDLKQVWPFISIIKTKALRSRLQNASGWGCLFSWYTLVVIVMNQPTLELNKQF